MNIKLYRMHQFFGKHDKNNMLMHGETYDISCYICKCGCLLMELEGKLEPVSKGAADAWSNATRGKITRMGWKLDIPYKKFNSLAKQYLEEHYG